MDEWMEGHFPYSSSLSSPPQFLPQPSVFFFLLWVDSLDNTEGRESSSSNVGSGSTSVEGKDAGRQTPSPSFGGAGAGAGAGGFVKDTVETNLLASRLEALNVELFKDPRIAKFFERPAKGDDIDWRWWGLLVSDYDNVTKRSYRTVVEKVHAGVPRQMRGMVWQKFTGSKATNLEEQFKLLNEVIISSSPAPPHAPELSNYCVCADALAP